MGTKLYVGNLNYNTTEESLRGAFGANGREVTSVSIIMDRETGRSRGFAFVEMSTAEFAQQALQELDGQELDGRMLRINEAMIDQMQASDQWAYYQAKGIKSSILQSKMELLESLGKDPSSIDEGKMAEYKNEQKEIEKVAREKGESSEKHFSTHVTLARAVTVFQVAIALGAIAVLTRRKLLWHVSLVLGAGGIGFLTWGLM